MAQSFDPKRTAVQAIFSQWRGRWRLHRTIDNRRDTTLSGLVTGTACIQSPATLGGDSLLHYREAALFQTQAGACIDVRRCFAYRLDAPCDSVTAFVMATPGSEVCPHRLHFESLSAASSDGPSAEAVWLARGGYDCGADRYEVCYEFHLNPMARLSQLYMTYWVRGPCKDYRTRTRLTRLECAQVEPNLACCDAAMGRAAAYFGQRCAEGRDESHTAG